MRKIFIKKYRKLIRPVGKKIAKRILVIFLVISWLLTSWPKIPFTSFPRKIDQAGAAPIAQYTGGLLVYADGTAGTPKYQVFDDTNGFLSEQSASSVGSAAIEWIRVAASPTNDEWIIATRDADDDIDVQVCTGVDGGVSCGSPTNITTTAGTHGFRNYDVAYEQSSGDALLVYGTATADELRKIEWTGGAWTSDAAITTSRTSGTVEWVELTARPNSDQIGIAYTDSNDDGSAYRWNGSAAANEATAAIGTAGSTGDVRSIDVSFEGTSGDMIVFHARESVGTFDRGELSGTSWTITGEAASDDDNDFVDLQEPNPSDNDIAIVTHGIATTSNDVEGVEWDGANLVDPGGANGLSDVDITSWAANYMMAAVSYVSSTFYAVAVYSDANDDINWWTMNSAGTWSSQTDNARTRGTIRFIDIFDYPNNDKVLMFSSDANSDLWADTWDGSTPSSTVWSDLTSGGTLEGSLSSATTKVYDFAFRLSTVSASNPTYTQNHYRWYVDSDNENVTDIWGNPDLAEDTGITIIPAASDPPSTSQELRLRVNITVNTATITANSKYFKLQHRTGTDSDCSTGSWTDVGSGAWTYATSGVTDDTTLTVAKLTGTDRLETYSKSKPANTPTATSATGEDIEFDFHIIGSSASTASRYLFRVVETTGDGSGTTDLAAWTNCPVLTTEPGTENLMRHGNVFSEGSEKGFFWAN